MRLDHRWGVGFTLATLAACGQGAAPSPSPPQQAATGSSAEPDPAVADAALSRSGEPVRDAEPGTGSPLATFAAFHELWQADPVGLGGVVFSRTDFQRLFTARRVGAWDYGAAHLMADFDDDWVEEAVVAVGKGWWEDGYDLLLLTAVDGGLGVTSSQRVAARGRYPPRLHRLAGVRSNFFSASRSTGSGTGYSSSERQLFEVVDDRAVEVLRLTCSVEYAPYPVGPSFTMGLRSFELADDPAGSGLVARSRMIIRVSDDLGEDFGGCDVELDIEFGQQERGGRLVLQRPEGWRLEDFALEPLFAIAVNSWLERYEASALRLATNGDARQQQFLRMACLCAQHHGAHRVADAVRILLPPAPPRRR